MAEKKIKNLGYIGVGGQKGYVFDISGVIPTIPATTYKDAQKILIEVRNDKQAADNSRTVRGRERRK